jgi:hypothetical protein
MIRCSTFKLLLLATASVAATGCALKPVESPPTEARDHNCAAPDSLHLVSTSTSKPEVDPEIDSLLAQETQDARLMQINRRMYQSLHALDVELRRQQAIAACKQPSLDGSILEAQSMLGSRPAPSSHAASQNSLAPGATVPPVMVQRRRKLCRVATTTLWRVVCVRRPKRKRIPSCARSFGRNTWITGRAQQ